MKKEIKPRSMFGSLLEDTMDVGSEEGKSEQGIDNENAVYFGNDGVNYFYLVVDKDDAENPNKVQIINQEEEEVFTAEITEEETIKDLILRAMDELKISNIAYEVLIDFFVNQDDQPEEEEELTGDNIEDGEGKNPAEASGEEPQIPTAAEESIIRDNIEKRYGVKFESLNSEKGITDFLTGIAEKRKAVIEQKVSADQIPEDDIKNEDAYIKILVEKVKSKLGNLGKTTVLAKKTKVVKQKKAKV